MTTAKKTEYHYFDDEAGLPIITLGITEPEAIIVETGTLPENYYTTLQSDVEMQEPVDFDTKASLVANYMNETENNEEQPAETENSNSINQNVESLNGQSVEESDTVVLKVRSNLQDFSDRSDKSVNCKLCGKIFASRQHWYRHKHRVHVVQPPVNPVLLNKCEECLISFESRKGYLGHMSSKHSKTLQDVTPVLKNEQAAAVLEKSPEIRITRVANPAQSKKESDPEMAIPKTILQNYQALPAPARVSTRNASKTRRVDRKKATQASDEMEPKVFQERRVDEESLVMGIIEKVRRQCATEPGVANRRGYSRKPYSART